MTTILIECPECQGAGEVRHPRWGSRSCPSPEITCPFCGGRGEVSQDALEEWEDDHRPYRTPDAEGLDPRYADAEEPF